MVGIFHAGTHCDKLTAITNQALPHREVSAADFYKHIADDGLPEPRRMRQLLIWCATRALEEKPSGLHSEDRSAALAGNVFELHVMKLSD